MPDTWLNRLESLLSDGPCVMVTVIEVLGSAPRAPGSRMFVTTEGQQGSIGGGNLEYQATATARRMLTQSQVNRQQTGHFGLGPALNQCCGGSVTLLFEQLTDEDFDCLRDDGPVVAELLVAAIGAGEKFRYRYRAGSPMPEDFPPELEEQLSLRLQSGQSGPWLLHCGDREFFVELPTDRELPLALFGAGHVGKALVPVLAELPFRIRWLDNRAGQFPEDIPANVEAFTSKDLASEVGRCQPGTLFLVMTHSHDLDEDICFEVLVGTDAPWLGLIGSKTKRARFAHRLAKRGVSAKNLERLVCPVGQAGIAGKRPATIAVSIAAQLLMEQLPAEWR